ncbi:hypothetical protein GN956_G24673 [Arapaima gigas]
MSAADALQNNNIRQADGPQRRPRKAEAATRAGHRFPRKRSKGDRSFKLSSYYLQDQLKGYCGERSSGRLQQVKRSRRLRRAPFFL